MIALIFVFVVSVLVGLFAQTVLSIPVWVCYLPATLILVYFLLGLLTLCLFKKAGGA